MVPFEGWLPLVLLTIAVYSVVYSVTAAISIDHSSILWVTTALGLLAGLLVAKSNALPQAVLHISTCIIGYWIALFLTSTLAYHISIVTMLSTLRLVITTGFALSGEQNSNMVFLFYLSFLCFFLGYFGAWLIYRAHLPWLVALVYVSIMIVNLNYVPQRNLSFLVVILISSLLLLIARIHLATQLTQWKSDGLYTDHTWLRAMTARFLRISTIFVLIILPFSWLLPVFNQPAAGTSLWDKLDNAWINLSHGHIDPNGLFDTYNAPTNFFSDQLTISNTVNLPNGTVLYYTSSAPTQGQYLEGFTYDNFDGYTAWDSRVGNTIQSHQANDPLPLDNPNSNSMSLQTSITVVQAPGGTRHYIFGPAQPSSFNVPTNLFTDNSGLFTAAWTQSNALNPGEHYQVTSQILTASASDLSTIPLPTRAPDAWQSDPYYGRLQQYYLRVPDTLSPEVLATTKLWTSGAKNAYDAVIALQNHLSDPEQFTYSVVNTPIPPKIDIATWLLHTHKGYCTYYLLTD